MTDKVFNVPVVTNDHGRESRVIGVADVNYETGQIIMDLGIDVTAVLQGTFHQDLHYVSVHFSGLNSSDQSMEMRHGAWTSMLERKEEFERVSKEE